MIILVYKDPLFLSLTSSLDNMPKVRLLENSVFQWLCQCTAPLNMNQHTSLPAALPTLTLTIFEYLCQLEGYERYPLSGYSSLIRNLEHFFLYDLLKVSILSLPTIHIFYPFLIRCQSYIIVLIPYISREQIFIKDICAHAFLAFSSSKGSGTVVVVGLVRKTSAKYCLRQLLTLSLSSRH